MYLLFQDQSFVLETFKYFNYSSMGQKKKKTMFYDIIINAALLLLIMAN
jgi:hypothetical protein